MSVKKEKDDIDIPIKHQPQMNVLICWVIITRLLNPRCFIRDILYFQMTH